MGGHGAAGACPRYHPSGPVLPTRGHSLYLGPAFQSNGRANRQTARLRSKHDKVSQNDEVSPKSLEKACHSPYFQNGLQKSALDFLRFPFGPAFSPKELMGRFDPYPGLKCQNDEVSPDVHTYVSTRRVADTPTAPQQAATGAAPHLLSAGPGSYGILNGSGFLRFYRRL